MEYPGKYCRLCRSESEFNVSLFGNYCKKTNIAEKIFVCLKINIDDRDRHCTICFRCTDNLERCFDFITYIQRAQSSNHRHQSVGNTNTRPHATSYQRPVDSSDMSLSFMKKSKNSEEKEPPRKNNSSLLFSFVTPDNNVIDDSFLNVETSEPAPRWKSPPHVSPRTRTLVPKPLPKTKNSQKKSRYSGDMFSSETQEDANAPKMDWQFSPDESIIQKIRNKCFSHLNFS